MHLVGERELHPGQRIGQNFGRAQLVGRVAVRVQEADRDGLHSGVAKDARGRVHFGFVQRHEHGAVGEYALGHPEPQLPRDERRRKADVEAEDRVLDLAPHLQDVAEAAGGDEPGARALSLQDDVGDERGGVVDVVGSGQVARMTLRKPIDALEHADVGPCAGGQALLDGDLAARRVQQHEVRERAPDVDAQTIRAHSQPREERGAGRCPLRTVRR